LGLGPDITRRPTKMYIGYFVGKKSFCTVELQKAKIWVYMSIPPGEAQPWTPTEMRDVTNVGHFGMGDTEFLLTSPDQLPRLEALLKQSYLRNRK
jgi:predicted transport protein